MSNVNLAVLSVLYSQDSLYGARSASFEFFSSDYYIILLSISKCSPVDLRE